MMPDNTVKIAGFDPYMTVLHEISHGKPLLTCDFVEEYQAFLGYRMVLGRINRKRIHADDFIIRKSPSPFGS